MGLLSIIRKVKRKEREMRLLMVGLDNAGKTTVVRRVNGEDITGLAPTVGFHIKTMTYNVGGVSYRLNVWDVGGQRSLRGYWRNYFEKTDALVWVVDSGDVMRMDECAAELSALLGEERLLGATLLVLANKQDLSGALSVDEVSKRLGLTGESVGKTRHWQVAACSAATGEGLLDAFHWVVSDVASRLYALA